MKHAYMGNEQQTIQFDEFRKLDIRIAEIVCAKDIPGSDKLLDLTVSLGDEERRIIAGIKKSYSKEKLVGRKIVVVANIAPKNIMGFESRGMLMAAAIYMADGEMDGVALLVPDGDPKPGTRIT